MAFIHQIDETVEIYGNSKNPRLIMTCEHASKRIPFEHSLSLQEQQIVNDHWGWDIGISELTKQLCHNLDALSIHARFSRLVCDANRDPSHPTLVLEKADGVDLSFNPSSPELAQSRLDHFHVPYHDKLDQLLRQNLSHKPILLSMHSFTPVWNHQLRQMDIGVLFDKEAPLNQNLYQALCSSFFTAQNQPYSGKHGMMYSATRHGQNHQLPYLELEVNQHLLSTAERIRQVANAMTPCLSLWLSELTFP
ncbi:MAG: N-formylglutamate amidohydrolase [Myxococcota bacterium]